MKILNNFCKWRKSYGSLKFLFADGLGLSRLGVLIASNTIRSNST
ncbi:MAG: hypothetical protein AB1414_18695 [bacterium]